MCRLSSYLLLPLTLIISVVFLSSCTKLGGKEVMSGDKVRLSVEGVLPEGTKVTSSEGLVSTLDILVFRDNGSLECHKRVNTDTAYITVTSGKHYFWHVVANASEGAFSETAARGQFLSSLWTLDNVGNFLPMVGSGDGVLEEDSQVEVSLTRMVSKVTLGSVTPSFLSKTYKGSIVKLERVYLINVVGSCPYSGVPSAGEVWYNRMSLESLESPLAESLSKSFFLTVDGEESLSAPCSFVCCPNPVDNDITSRENPDWSQRNTRLVIELSVDGVMNYYPVDMPAMELNNIYVINEVILNGPGSSNPDIPVRRSAVSFTVSVNPWGGGDDRQLDF